MTCLRGRILREDGAFRKGRIEFGETIREIADEGSDGPYIIPGLIDIHTHGAAGFDFSEASPDEIREMSLFYAKNGVTSFLATTITEPADALAGAMKNIALFERPENGARCLGINMEGPFLSYEKRGAHQADFLMAPDIGMFEQMNALSKNGIKLVSVAPELPGAMAFIREASKACGVSLAHSAAGYDIASEAFENGASHVTHLYNAMSPFSHRDPGIPGAAMDAGACVEIICDGIHLHPSVIRAVYRMFKERVCMISDSVRATGLPDGEYELGGLPIIIKDGKSTLLDGTIAGSIITLMQGVRNAVSFGVPPADAATAATFNNAHAIGAEKAVGTLSEGKLADIVVLDEDLNIQAVYIGGREISLSLSSS